MKKRILSMILAAVLLIALVRWCGTNLPQTAGDSLFRDADIAPNFHIRTDKKEYSCWGQEVVTVSFQNKKSVPFGHSIFHLEVLRDGEWQIVKTLRFREKESIGMAPSIQSGETKTGKLDLWEYGLFLFPGRYRVVIGILNGSKLHVGTYAAAEFDIVP